MHKINYDKELYGNYDRKEPGKEIYYKFIDYAVKRCDMFVLTIWGFKEDYNVHECSIMKALEPYFIKSEKLERSVHEDINEFKNDDYLYYYKCCEEVIPILKSVSEGFYYWGSDNCPPEDLTFLLENNEIWYESISHEFLCRFYIDKKEHNILEKELQGIELFNEYESNVEYILAYYEDPGKDVYKEALKYAEKKSDYFDLEIFIEAEDLMSDEIIQESLREYDIIKKLSPYKVNSQSELLKDFPVEMIGFPKGKFNGIAAFDEYDIKNYDKNTLSNIERYTIFESREDEEEFKNTKIEVVFKDTYYIKIKYKLNAESMKIIKNAAEIMFYWEHKNKMPDVLRFYRDDIKNTWLVVCNNDGFKTSYVKFENNGEFVRFQHRTDNKGIVV